MGLSNVTKTEFLFGYPKERYGVELMIIANMRIEDGMELLRELQPQVKHYPDEQDQFQKDLRLRISKVQDAIAVWEKIRDIEDYVPNMRG